MNNKNNYEMDCAKGDATEEYLEKMLDGIKPKARYLAEMHTEEFIDQIYMEIINGDSQVAQEKTPFADPPAKHGFEEVLRQRMLSDAARQKQQLQQKIQYLSHSINTLQKYEEYQSLKKPKSLRQSLSVSGHREREEWRADIDARGKKIEVKKKAAEEIKQKKQQELKEVEERMHKEEQQRKRKVAEERLQGIEERSKKRQEDNRESNQRYMKLRKEKRAFHRLSESFNEREESLLEERKKKLAQIRNLHRPIDDAQLREHQARFLEGRRQKQQMREREKRMNSSRSSAYQPGYRSVFYQRALEQSRTDVQNTDQAKKDRMRQFAERIRNQFAPEVDERKRQKIEAVLEQERRKEELKKEKEIELAQKAKNKGKEYLAEVRNLPKKAKSNSVQPSSEQSRIIYQNYLTHHQQAHGQRPWAKILTSSDDKQGKALQLQIHSQRREAELKRKEQQGRLLKQGGRDDIDQEYVEMIKAKLDLLQTGS